MSIVIDFLQDHRIAALATASKGNIHASAVHYSFIENPLTLFFQTDATTRKAQDLLDGNPAKAAAVIGISETEWKTLQMEGLLEKISDKQKAKQIMQIHHDRFPGVLEYLHETTIFIQFIPTWWRYTDFTTTPKTVLSM